MPRSKWMSWVPHANPLLSTKRFSTPQNHEEFTRVKYPSGLSASNAPTKHLLFFKLFHPILLGTEQQ